MTSVSHSQSIPSLISNFLKTFYKISDTESLHEEYASSFTSPTHFHIGPMTPISSHEAIVEWRRKGWEKIGQRKHIIHDVFVHPDRQEEIMLYGSLEMGFRDGTQGKAHWGGRMILDGIDDGKEVKIKSYTVWITPEQK